ncbi:MAG: hypothetical protein GX126_00490 [Bacteroidales bacterium]|jgi:hypothetical protein|nr:hypothetical protein [Bacteroidales bacterium]
MKPNKYHHIGKHFFHRKAIIEYYDVSNKLLGRDEFIVEPENRFLFFGLHLDELYVSYDDNYEIFIYENFDLKEIEGKYYYVPDKTGNLIEQDIIDKEIIKKLYLISSENIPKYLYYQIKKYRDRKGRLKEWKKLIEDNTNFYNNTNSWQNYKQKIALEWINTRIRKKNLRDYRPQKDISLNELFISPEQLQSVIEKLIEKGYVRYYPFEGRYKWLSKGQDLAVFGEILQKKNYFKDWIDYPIRYNALTKYFGVRGKHRFSERTFRKATIEEVYYLKSGQFSFIRPIQS